jgi:cytochrome c oxidase subunit 2
MDTSFRLFPEQASSISTRVDALFGFLVLVSGIATLLIAGAIIYFAIKYRRGSPASRTPVAAHFLLLEASWIGVPFVLSMIMFFWGARLYFQEVHAPAGALEIQCVAKQWMWKFQHPEGRAEINDLHLPLGRAIKVQLISEDVIHSLYVPAFRVKQDVLPGRYTSLWFEPTKVGQYHLFCAEYCGAKHSAMGGRVIVLEPSEYEAWLSGRAATEPSVAGSQRLLDELRCSNCHQGGGMVSRCPPLENLFGRPVRLQDGRTVVADETYLRESILQPAAKVVAGYQPVMPSYEGQIGEETILRLIAEIKSLSPASRATGEPAPGPERSPQR